MLAGSGAGVDGNITMTMLKAIHSTAVAATGRLWAVSTYQQTAMAMVNITCHFTEVERAWGPHASAEKATGDGDNVRNIDPNNAEFEEGGRSRVACKRQQSEARSTERRSEGACDWCLSARVDAIQEGRER